MPGMSDNVTLVKIIEVGPNWALIIGLFEAIGTIGAASIALWLAHRGLNEQKMRDIDQLNQWLSDVGDWGFTPEDDKIIKADEKKVWENSWFIITSNIQSGYSLMRQSFMPLKISSRMKKMNKLNESLRLINAELYKCVQNLETMRNRIDFSAETTPKEFIEAVDNLNKQRGVLMKQVGEATDILFNLK
jgi:hypothetical protein